MAVVVDATGTKLITTVAGTSVNYTGITVGTGVNRALVVTVACAAAVTAPSATWDSGVSNQAMTLISVIETQTNVTTFMFGLRNPVSGNKTLNVAWTTSAKSNVEAISFTGVEQASDARAFTLNNFVKDGATLNAITMGITPPRDSIVVASYATSATFSTLNQTNLFTDITNTGCEGGATRATGAGISISFTGTDTTTTGNKVMVGFAVVSDSAPPTVPWPDPVRSRPGLAAHLQSFIVAEPFGPPPEAVAKVDRWFAPFAEPVRVKPGLPAGTLAWSTFTPAATPFVSSPIAEVPKRVAFAAWQQQTLAWSGFTPATASTAVVASEDGSSGPVFRRRIIYRVKTGPVFVPTTAVTYTPTPQWPDRVAAKPSPLNYGQPALVPPTQPTVWSQPAPWPDLFPTRKQPVADFGTFVPPAQVTVSYASWPDFVPGRKLPAAEQQALAWTPFVATAITTVIDWNFSIPVWSKSKVVQQQTLAFYPLPIPPVVAPPADGWVLSFAEVPRRPTFATSLQQALAWSGFTPVPVISTAVVASDDGSSGPVFRRRIIYRVKTEPVFVPAVAQVFSPYAPWDDFTRRKNPPLDTQPLAWSTFTPAAAQVFSPYAPWADFAKKPGFAPWEQQALAWSGFTPAPVGWASPFPELPIRRSFATSEQQSLAWTPIVVPSADGWIAAFAEVPRVKTLHASQQQSFTFSPFPIPPSGWVSAFAEVPKRSTFAAWQQQVLAWSTFTPATQVFFPYAPWDDFAKKPGFAVWQQQALAWSTFTPATAVFFLPDRWPDFATDKKRPLNYDSLAFLQIVQAPFNSFVNWPDFATKKKPSLNYEPLAFLQVIRSPFNSFVNWPDFARGPRRPLNYEPLALLQTTRTPWVTMTTWPDFAHLERKPGLGAPYQQFTARFVGTVTAATVTVSMSAFEVNSDTANAVVRVIQSQPAASALVSIEETGILIDPIPGSP